MTPQRTSPRELAQILKNQIVTSPLPEKRSLIAVAGPPAVGKSTIASELVAALKEAGYHTALVAMDGFHLDNQVLAARGVLPSKGAPETFDLSGFHHALHRLRAGEDVVLPTFCRRLDKAIAGSVVVEAAHSMVVVEGNYLAFDEPGWRDLADFWDYSIRLTAPTDVLQRRLVDRWVGFDLDRAEAERKAFENDIPNAKRITKAELPVDFTLEVKA